MNDLNDRDIIDGSFPGGTNTSHTIAVAHLSSLLAALPRTATRDEYEEAAVEHNVLGRATIEGRRRTFRYLRELYFMDPSRLLFRALRDLWDEDLQSQRLLAGLSALARDSVFRASARGLLPISPGTAVSSGDLADYVTAVFPGAYNAATAAKIGRNTASSWAQAGHLKGRRHKTRQKVEGGPAAAAYALLLGHLQGERGQSLYGSLWARFLDATPREMQSLAEVAAGRAYIELRSGGGVVEIGFRHLLRPLN